MNVKKTTLLLLAALLPLCVNQCRSPEQTQLAEVRAVYRTAFPAVMRIEVVSKTQSQGRDELEPSVGSGAIIDPAGYVVTNHHVAGNADKITCRFTDGTTVKGTLVGTDAMTDIAVIRLDLSGHKEPLPFVKWGNSDALEVGQSVFAIGCPGALAQSVTRGIIANPGFIMPRGFTESAFRLDGANVGTLVRWVLHDAQIFGGNSGGPLVNMQSEIVGINEISYAGLAGAVPSNLAKKVVAELIARDHVERSVVGISVQPRFDNAANAAGRGALIGGVRKGSPADKAGICAGDVLLSFDGVEVNCRVPEDMPAFNQLEMSTPAGKTVHLTVLRGKETLGFDVTMQPRPSDTVKRINLEPWSATFCNITPALLSEVNLSAQKGALVLSSRSGGPLGSAKPALGGGDVIVAFNGEKVNSVDDLQAKTDSFIAKNNNVPTQVLIEVVREKRNIVSVATVGKPVEAPAPKRAKRAWFSGNVQVLTPDMKRLLNLEKIKGVRITEVFPGYGAEKAGLKAGDYIVAFDGAPIDVVRAEDEHLFTDMISEYRVGDEVDITLLRDGKRQTLKLTLEDAPTLRSQLESFEEEALGISVRDLSFDEKIAAERTDARTGVVISGIRGGSRAAIAGLSAGFYILDVEGVPTPDIETFKKVMADLKARNIVAPTLFIKNGNHTAFVNIAE